MVIAASRWRLIELKRKRESVRAGVDLLDRKREALVRELHRRISRAADQRVLVGSSLAQARRVMLQAVIDIGRPAAEASALAQQPAGGLLVSQEFVIGVRVPRLAVQPRPFRINYGPGGTSEALDSAARRYHELLAPVLELAGEETAVANLRTALRRTVRTLNALKDVVLPSLDTEIHAVSDALEEDERDDSLRRRAAVTEWS